MNLLLLGMTLDFAGGMLIAYTAIQVHYRFRKEHKVDDQVFQVMRREHWIGLLGMISLTLGFILQMIHFLGV